ncbi:MULTISPECIES: class I SAM-dependent methyltransferase [unclassified Streptomyces]|uniref:class I SAM-dependent DNA methyltransferase n=1 Tax=Streptomyces sp. A1499 TaxID=2563104 RepID=UPI000A9F52D7|nr:MULTISPECIES: class I SAM-dependent methyltransferase [unclassified Streptomyces]
MSVDRRGQAEAFDAIGRFYDDAFPHKEGQLAAGRRLAEALPPGSRVLDVGCGTGLPTARQLTEAGLTVLGTDISAGMLELAGKNVPAAEFRQIDIADLRADGPNGIGRFDGIACFFSLLMLPRPEIPEALRRLHGLLRPAASGSEGGLLALSMVEADLDDATIPFLGRTIRVSGYLGDELRQVVRDAGFDIVDETTYSYAPTSTDVPPEQQIFLHCRRG